MKFLAALVSHSRQPARRPEWSGYPARPEISPPPRTVAEVAPALPEGHRQTAVPARPEPQDMDLTGEMPETARRTPEGIEPRPVDTGTEPPTIGGSREEQPRSLEEPQSTPAEAVDKPEGFPAHRPAPLAETQGRIEVRSESDTATAPAPEGRSETVQMPGEMAMDSAGETGMPNPPPSLDKPAGRQEVLQHAAPPSPSVERATVNESVPELPAEQAPVAGADRSVPDQPPGEQVAVPESPRGEPAQQDQTRRPGTQERVRVRAEMPRQPAAPRNPLPRQPTRPAQKPEVPQVRIGQINVLVEDQTPAKPQPRSAAAKPKRANPFGLRGL